jgi:membrane dipeptidase
MKTANVGKRTKYEGYKSFEYLEPGTDYREFKLARELDRVPSRKVDVSDAQEERVWRLLDQNVAVSLHDHCVMIPEDPGELGEHRRQGRDFTGYAGMAVSGLDAVFDNLLDGTGTITSKNAWKWDDVVYDLGMRLSDLAHQDFIVRGESLDDVKRAKENGQIAFIASLEAATSPGGQAHEQARHRDRRLALRRSDVAGHD